MHFINNACASIKEIVSTFDESSYLKISEAKALSFCNYCENAKIFSLLSGFQWQKCLWPGLENLISLWVIIRDM